ncbi:MAG TPA: polyphenol oxidase family protein [Candidatus Olsenella avicola]|nr:polyphenol oxidase family protein [Candidatus Olsenella avicola]
MRPLARYRAGDVTLLSASEPAGHVALAFTERTGGVSAAPYESLNLGASCGDDEASVRENRLRALAAIGAAGLEDRLVCPKQVHGDHVVLVRSAAAGELEAARAEAAAGADAVVCTAANVPVLLCFADCVPVVITCPGGFAVAHSGWRGTIARISEKAARALVAETGCDPSELRAYVGPHIKAADYEVSEELLGRFVDAFGDGVALDGRHLDLEFAVVSALEAAGVEPGRIEAADVSTASATHRFFSYRAEGGRCGRHGALAVMGERPWAWSEGALANDQGEEARA